MCYPCVMITVEFTLLSITLVDLVGLTIAKLMIFTSIGILAYHSSRYT